MAPLTLPAQPAPAHALFQMECPPVSLYQSTLRTTHPLGTGDRLLDSKLSCLDGQDVCEGPKRQAAEGKLLICKLPFSQCFWHISP